VQFNVHLVQFNVRLVQFNVQLVQFNVKHPHLLKQIIETFLFWTQKL